ncbi:putative reverse transcriptase domain, reverse transcriptase zinc-binding domain protein [Tanacetum coccineum]
MIMWIMECVSMTSFSISINGSLHGYFKGKRGLRQGDPLSPYLFMIVMEVLMLILKRRTRNLELFTYHRFCSRMELINLCFVDDLFLFAHGDANSAQIMPFKEGRLPVKYLGVPLVSSRLVFKDCKELIKRVESRLNDWKNKALSFAGRLQLVQLVIRSFHVFWASVFILPKRILLDIEQLMRGRRSWDQKVGSFQQSSYGVSNLEAIAKERVFVGDMALYLRPLIRKFIWHKVGDGSRVSIWYDQWCGVSPLSNIVSSRDMYRVGLNPSSMVDEVLVDAVRLKLLSCHFKKSKDVLDLIKRWKIPKSLIT